MVASGLIHIIPLWCRKHMSGSGGAAVLGNEKRSFSERWRGAFSCCLLACNWAGNLPRCMLARSLHRGPPLPLIKESLIMTLVLA